MRSRRFLLACGVALAAASAARADCAADFQAINARRAEASRFHARTEARVLDAQGNVRRRFASSAQFDLADGVRMKTSGLSSQADFIIVNGRGWRQDKAAWTAMPPAEVSEALKNLSANSYVHDAGGTNVACAGETPFEDEKRLTFRFDQQVNGMAMKVAAYFDPASRRPLATVAVAAVNDFKIEITTRFTIDPTIRIQAPE